MQTQALFKGLTRPAMLFGVPIIPLFFSLGITIFITISTQLFYLILFYIPLYVLMKQMTKQDNFIFRLYFLKLRFLTNPLSKKFHGIKSFQAMSYSKHKNYIKTNIPKLSLFALNSEVNFEKLIPFSSIIGDGIVLTKDYLLCSTYEIEGISFECESDVDLDFKNEALNMLFKSFANEPISFYFHNVRHSIDDNFVSNFKNPYLKG